MRLLSRSVIATLLVLQAGVLQALPNRFVEGIEYKLVLPVQQTTAPTGKVEVVEVFWYKCPHCFNIENTLNSWLKNKPANVHFVRMPAQFNRNWEIHAAAFYTAEILGLVEKTHHALFKEIHTKHKKMATVDDLAAFYVKYGVTREKFMSVFNSFAVRSRKAHAKGMVQRYGAHSVPTFIVNGKYMTNEHMVGSKKELFELIDILVEKESSKAVAKH